MSRLKELSQDYNQLRLRDLVKQTAPIDFGASMKKQHNTKKSKTKKK